MRNRCSRRGVLAAATGYGILGVTGVVAAGGQPPEREKSNPGLFSGGKFTLEPVETIASKSYSVNISDDGAAFTVLFDSLQIALGEDNGKLSMCRIASLQIPFRMPPDRRLAGFSHHIRGHVEKSKDARITLIASLGGSTKIFDYPEGLEVASGDFQHSPFSPRTRGRASDMPASLPIPVYTAQLILIGERLSKTASLTLNVDSLDLETAFFT